MSTRSINIRISQKEKKWLREVAAAKGMTLSGFLRDAVRIEASRVLKNPDVTPTLSETDTQ